MIKQIVQEKRRTIQSFCKRHKVEMLILFGSHATRGSHEQSDVDLAVQAATDAGISKLHLIQELETIFNHRLIDLTVITKDTDPLMLFEIFSSGLLLYENTRWGFENNRLKAWHLYLDTIPIRKLEKAYNKKHIRELGHVT